MPGKAPNDDRSPADIMVTVVEGIFTYSRVVAVESCRIRTCRYAGYSNYGWLFRYDEVSGNAKQECEEDGHKGDGNSDGTSGSSSVSVRRDGTRDIVVIVTRLHHINKRRGIFYTQSYDSSDSHIDAPHTPLDRHRYDIPVLAGDQSISKLSVQVIHDHLSRTHSR